MDTPIKDANGCFVDTSIIHSSHGTLTVNMAGKVVDKDICKDQCEDCIDNIDMVDLLEYMSTYGTDIPGDIDILDVGYWTNDGTYVPADSEWRKEFRQPKS